MTGDEAIDDLTSANRLERAPCGGAPGAAEAVGGPLTGRPPVLADLDGPGTGLLGQRIKPR